MNYNLIATVSFVLLCITVILKTAAMGRPKIRPLQELLGGLSGLFVFIGFTCQFFQRHHISITWEDIPFIMVAGVLAFLPVLEEAGKLLKLRRSTREEANQ